jgi:hypothetical protein
MQKYFTVFAVGLALCTSAHAIKSEEYQSSLDELQKKHPIIKSIRKDSIFEEASKKHLGTHSSSSEVLKAALIEVIPVYLKKMDSAPYFSFVEGLAHVWRASFGSLTMGEAKGNIEKVERKD